MSLEPTEHLLAALKARKGPEVEARVLRVLDDPASADMRERLAAALSYANTGMFSPSHALPYWMFHNDRYRQLGCGDADRFLLACDHVGLRVVDEFHGD